MARSNERFLFSVSHVENQSTKRYDQEDRQDNNRPQSFGTTRNGRCTGRSSFRNFGIVNPSEYGECKCNAKHTRAAHKSEPQSTCFREVFRNESKHCWPEETHSESKHRRGGK